MSPQIHNSPNVRFAFLELVIYISDSDLVWRMQLMIIKG